MMRALLAVLLCAGLLHGAEFAPRSLIRAREPIKVVEPFPPGGLTDGMARIISERLVALDRQS